MSALDQLSSLDALISNAKNEFESEKVELLASFAKEKESLAAAHAAEIQNLKDQLLAANMQVEIHKGITSEAHASRAAAQAMTTALLAQFSTISKTFEDVKAFAQKASVGLSSGVKSVETVAGKLESEAVSAVADPIENAKAQIEKALTAMHGNGNHTPPNGSPK